MNFELKAVTEPGERLVALAEEHAADFATRADQHDRENTFVTENFDAMKESGFFGGCAPEQFGGMGVDSVHDLTVAISRIARGCGSTAISANMHMVTVMILTRQWRQATASGDAMRAAGTQMALTMLGKSQIVMSVVGTERGGLTVVPSTEATPTDGGYLINGLKAFGTNSEYASSIIVMLKTPSDDGSYQLAMATVPQGAKGMEVKNNWDALGMRGSGSHEIEFKDCFVPTPMVNVLAPLGPPPPDGWLSIALGNAPLIGASLGIAEAARDYIIELARTRKQKIYDKTLAERPVTQMQVAEIEVGLTAARSSLSRIALAFDEFLAREDAPEEEETDELIKEWQATKLVVNRAAVDIVDRALTISGGSGYMSSSPLSRLYRDVRAGPFMQPYSPNEAPEFIGRVALGLDPYADLREAVERIQEEARAAKSKADGQKSDG